MIEKFIITNSLSDTLELELKHPEKSGIYVKDVTGLGYPSSNVSITNLVTSDIGHFNQSIYQSRNVVFTFGFITDVENNRQKIYDIFTSKTEVKVEIVTDVKTVYCKGIVETCDPNIFSEEETIQVSLICPNPYLININPIEEEFIGSPINVISKRAIEQGFIIEISAPDGIDNIKIEYRNGSIFYGSGEFKDPYIEEDEIESMNLIGANESILIDTNIEKFGIYKANYSTYILEEITDKCELVGDFPIFNFGNNRITVTANGFIYREGYEYLTILDEYKLKNDASFSENFSIIDIEKVERFNIDKETCNYVRLLLLDADTNWVHIPNDKIIGYIDVYRSAGFYNVQETDEYEENDINWFLTDIRYWKGNDQLENCNFYFWYGKPRFDNSSYPNNPNFENDYYIIERLYGDHIKMAKGNPFYKGTLSKYIDNTFYNSFLDWCKNAIIKFNNDEEMLNIPIYFKCAQYNLSISEEPVTYLDYSAISSQVQTKVTIPNYHDGL